jgi:uncharacterized protein GlcG (DUF336 family)
LCSTEGELCLPDANTLRSALQSVVKQGAQKNGGMGNQEWAVMVNRDGIACDVVYSGTSRSQEWPGSRVIAASKANTANGLSNSDYAISTANIFAAAQPGQSLYSLATSGPPNPQAVFGDPASFGTTNDPMVGKAVGGAIVFGGGPALYDGSGKIVGGLGLSGDTSCTDHIIAWKIRHDLHLDHVPMGPARRTTTTWFSTTRTDSAPADSAIPTAKAAMTVLYHPESVKGLPDWRENEIGCGSTDMLPMRLSRMEEQRYWNLSPASYDDRTDPHGTMRTRSEPSCLFGAFAKQQRRSAAPCRRSFGPWHSGNRPSGQRCQSVQ